MTHWNLFLENPEFQIRRKDSLVAQLGTAIV